MLREWYREDVPIVGMEPSCVAVFKDELGKLMPHDDDAKRLAGNVRHFAEFFQEFGIEPPRLLREVKAEYTDEARRRGITGDVVLEIVVRRDGTVGEVTVLQGRGAGLDQRAIAAVRQWRFSPARRRGEPVDVLVEVAVEFTLR